MQTGKLLNHFIVSFLSAIFLISSCTKVDIRKEFTVTATDTSNVLKLHPDKPNIVLIMSEDMGYEVPTCNGGESYETPTLDRLAREGIRFTQCHGSPMCAPSRWMLMTGKYNFRNYFYYGIMYTDQRTFANMLQNNGYRTGVYGKWALNGGDTSVHIFGFDNYAIWNPYKDPDPGDKKGFFYKNPSIYHNGAYFPDSLTNGKFGDDIFTDSVIQFIKANKNNPFFVYYPMTLSHIPACPTPDDPEFATWDPALKIDDTTFFRSQVKYTDKKIRQIIDKVKTLNISSETVIIVLFGDNGTRQGITSLFKGEIVPGSREQPTEYGTHVPFFVYWPGTVAPGVVNNDLIDFTDFLPTLADIAHIPVPVDYGKIDGVSFYPQLLGQTGTPREWIYDYYWLVPNRPGVKTFYEWVQNKRYKLYDSTSVTMSGNFYKFVNNTEQQPELNIDSLTKKEKQIRQQFLDVLKTEHNDPEYRFKN